MEQIQTANDKKLEDFPHAWFANYGRLRILFLKSIATGVFVKMVFPACFGGSFLFIYALLRLKVVIL